MTHHRSVFFPFATLMARGLHAEAQALRNALRSFLAWHGFSSQRVVIATNERLAERARHLS